MPLAEKYIVSCSGEKYILNEREILIIPAGTLHFEYYHKQLYVCFQQNQLFQNRH